MNVNRSYHVLMVDDSENDRLLLRHTIQNFPRFELVGELHDGTEAVDYLLCRGNFIDPIQHPFPDLLLLDLKMPKMTGYDVLQWLQSHSFPSLTVAVLSGSALPEDFHTCMALGAHGYWSKAAEPDKRRQIVEEIAALLDRQFSPTIQAHAQRRI